MWAVVLVGTGVVVIGGGNSGSVSLESEPFLSKLTGRNLNTEYEGLPPPLPSSQQQ